MKKNAILTGTIILTVTGFISRLIGFFYRIYLSQSIGAEGLGLYQLIFPLYSICFAICCGSIQTAISRNVAARCQENPQGSGKTVFQTGLFWSFGTSLILAFLMHHYADWLSVHILIEPRCAPLVKIMAFAVPFCSINSCISGYYYGLKKAHIPAISQLTEQLIRVFSFYLIAKIWANQDMQLDVSLAVIVMVMGEAASALFSSIMGSIHFSGMPKSLTRLRSVLLPNTKLLMAIALPLTANRLCISVLQSAEAIMIPSKLQQFGLSNAEAFSVYGTLTGMALPFILFPSAITNSIAVMLLPAMAEAQAAGRERKISHTASLTISYSLAMGLLCVGLFLEFGNDLGAVIFKNPMAGTYITILAWICPFLYIATTVGSILNGLGKTTTTFVHNLFGLVLRLLFVILLIPRIGILAYLWGMLASELLITLLHLISLKKFSQFEFSAVGDLLLPAAILAVAVGVSRCVQDVLLALVAPGPIIIMAVSCLALCLTYCGFMYIYRFRGLRRQQNK